MVLHEFCVVALSKHTYVTGMTRRSQNCAQIRFMIRNESLRYAVIRNIEGSGIVVTGDWRKAKRGPGFVCGVHMPNPPAGVYFGMSSARSRAE